ncbi:MAG: peptide chain release factor N(5)-glutamine methyltransferase [Candidatus Cryptobacteroides sp.]
MLLREFIAWAVCSLRDLYPEPEARNMVNVLLEERTGRQSWFSVAHPEAELGDAEMQGLLEDVGRLKSGEPLQYVLGFAWFYSRRFRVSPAVLIPRPETEILVDTVLSHLSDYARVCPDSSSRHRSEDAGVSGSNDAGGVMPVGSPRILDLCTGSGCIAWTLALECRKASVTAVDISPEALALARTQFESGRVVFVEADVLDMSEKGISGECSELPLGKYDVIVSNPPYVMNREKVRMRSNVLDYEPSIALFVPDDDPLIFYRAIAHHATRLLTSRGWGIVEINSLLADQTADCFRTAGFPSVSILPDLSGRPRFVLFSRI